MPFSAVEAMAGKTVSGLAGVAQTIGGLIGRHNNQKALNALQNPRYTPSKALADYYQTALNRYNAGPYNSAFYNEATKQANRGVAAGLSYLGDRRSALAGVPALIAGRDAAMEKAGVQGEAMQREALGQVGAAANAYTGDQRYAFDINQMMPFERRYSELSGKLQANNQMINAGINNLSTGLTGGGSGGGLGGMLGMTGMGGGRNAMSSYGGLGRASYSPGLAATGGGYNSPAGNFPYLSPAQSTPYIDPNSYSTF